MDNQDYCYVFQGNSILVPADTPDSELKCAVSLKNKSRLLNEYDTSKADDFSVPSNDFPPKMINALALYGSEIPRGWKEIPVRQALNIIEAGSMIDGTGNLGGALKAFHIAQWRRESKFCGTCGSPNTDSPDELARLCASCGRLEFPRISPAVITIVVNDNDEALLAHNRKFAAGMYSLIAGFNEAGENLEATVVREIMEETAIEVKDIRYIKSQPWPFPNSLMTGFFARYAGGTIKVDNVEIEDAGWYSRDKIPSIPGYGSVSRYLIDLWLNKKL